MPQDRISNKYFIYIINEKHAVTAQKIMLIFNMKDVGDCTSRGALHMRSTFIRTSHNFHDSRIKKLI